MKRISYFIGPFLLLLILLPSRVADAADEPGDLAGRAYYDQKYGEAIRLYLKQLEEGGNPGHIYYNLGNANYHLSRWGEASLYYEKARRFIPRDPDLNANIEFLKNRRGERFETEIPLLSLAGLTFFWNSHLTTPELGLVLGVVIALLFATAMPALFLRKPFLRWGVVVFLGAALILAGSFAAKFVEEDVFVWAVILRDSVALRPSFFESRKSLMTLNAGDKVRVVSRQDVESQGWLQVEVNHGQKGWILVGEGGII